MAVYESLIESAQNDSRKNLEGQMSLFQLNAEQMEVQEASSRLPDVENFPKESLISMEKEMLGVYISDHPLKDYEEQIRDLIDVTSEDLIHAAESGGGRRSPASGKILFDGMRATMAGIITGKKTLVTKNNKMMAFADMEDLYGNVEIVVFPNVYERSSALVQEDSLVVVKGSINFKEGEVPKLLANEIRDLKQASREAKMASHAPVKIRIPDSLENGLERIRDILIEHKGEMPVIIYLGNTGKAMKTKPDLWVSGDDSFRSQVIGLIGETNLKM